MDKTEIETGEPVGPEMQRWGRLPEGSAAILKGFWQDCVGVLALTHPRARACLAAD